MLAVQAEAGDALPQATALRLHQVAYRACRALGAVDEALLHLEQCDLLQRTRSARQLRAQSVLMVTRIEAERARQHARDAEARAAEQARHARQDALTGLGNRRQLDEMLPPLLAAAAARHQPLALAMVDVDHFKLANDHHGHRVGDLVLVELANLLRDNTRSTDLVCRMGGEEFMLVLPDMHADEALQTCERLRRQVQQQRWSALSPGLAVTVSIGLVQAPPYDMTTLYEQADRALYRAKDSGRNRVCSA
jgi:diguanylate cyclase (GGDEF)-like protein